MYLSVGKEETPFLISVTMKSWVEVDNDSEVHLYGHSREWIGQQEINLYEYKKNKDYMCGLI